MSLIQPLPPGPLDIIGDVHGEYDALLSLLAQLGYDQDGQHPAQRHLVFVGDFVDRGPDSPAVLALARRLMASGRALAVSGNHEINLLREDPKDGSGWFFDSRTASDEAKYAPFAQPESAAERQAAGQVSQAQRALAELRGQWRTLTGLTQIATPDETIPAASADAAVNQPLVMTAHARVRAAQARLALTEADRRDAPELGVGITREKALAGDVAHNALRLSLRIPFGSIHRNAPRLAAARAELDTAYAELDATQRQVQTDLVWAREALQAAQAAAVLASERAEFSAQAQALVARSYHLGESDLPSRLRADNERFDAELAATRARANTQRAIARLNQSSGILP